jgi:GDP-mannose 6-dehydrogenase
VQISIFGLGYVGSTTIGCLADLGHHLTGVDPDDAKVRMIASGLSPVTEPGLSERIARHAACGRIRATQDARKAIAETDAALVCVGTPAKTNGSIDTTYLDKVIMEIHTLRMKLGKLFPILVRSTALPAVHARLIQKIKNSRGGRRPVAYVVHPEFLREGMAVADFYSPPKTVFGCSDDSVKKVCQKLYKSMAHANTFYTDPVVAAMVKYSDNCFHALKVTFANEVGMISAAMGVDPRKVMDIFCQDTKLNISTTYLRPGFAFGGSCLPKDLKAVIAWGRQNMLNIPMLESIIHSNDQQILTALTRILARPCNSVGIFGLAFKDGTDDLRESPMVRLAEMLYGKGKRICIYDSSLAMDSIFGQNKSYALQSLPHLAQALVKDAGQVVRQSDFVLLARNFDEIAWKTLPWRKDQIVFDLLGNLDLKGIQPEVEGLYWNIDGRRNRYDGTEARRLGSHTISMQPRAHRVCG